MKQLPKSISIFPADVDESGGVFIPVELRQLMRINIGDEVTWVKTEAGLHLRRGKEGRSEAE